MKYRTDLLRPPVLLRNPSRFGWPRPLLVGKSLRFAILQQHDWILVLKAVTSKAFNWPILPESLCTPILLICCVSGERPISRERCTSGWRKVLSHGLAITAIRFS